MDSLKLIDEIERILQQHMEFCRDERCRNPHHRRRAVKFEIKVRQLFKFRRTTNKMSTNTFADGSPLLLLITNVVDQFGNPAVLPVTPVWTSSDATILSPSVATDGLSATGTALASGTVTITATAGSITSSVAITVTAGQAVNFQITVSVAPSTPPAPPSGPPTS